MKKRMLVYLSIFIFLAVVTFITAGTYKQVWAFEVRKDTQGQEFLKKHTGKELSKDIEFKEDNNVKISYKNKKVKSKVYEKLNRYYINVNDYAEALNVKIERDGENIIINDSYINLEEEILYKDNEGQPLRGDVFIKDNEVFFSLIDINEALNLATRWNQKENTIDILNKVKGKKKKVKKSLELDSFLRLEDFTAGNMYTNSEVLEKVRIAGDYLGDNELNFSLAWVPRYINPEKGIDNDLITNKNIANAEFLYTLDYLIFKGASVGLHGYTHQYKDEESIVGSEFGKDQYNDIETLRSRVEDAITEAKLLNIDYKFWESPHYTVTKEQQIVLEEYFDILYEPSHQKFNHNIYISEDNLVTKYIPAPLSYVKDNDVDDMLNKIRNKDENDLMSLFYHPAKEGGFIEVNKDNKDFLQYSYSEESILKKIVNELEIKGYKLAKLS